MVPLLAPLIGSLAGSAMGAGMSAGIASALGGGAIASMIGAAAPAALGAGIGTLAAGGDIGEAIGNAAMFGGGAGVMSAAGGGLGGLFTGPEAAAAAAPATSPTAVPVSPAVATAPPPPPPRPMPATAAAPAMAPMDVMRTLQMAGSMGQPEPVSMPSGGMQPGVQRGRGTGSAMGMFAQPQQAPSPFMGAPMTVQPIYGGIPTMYARDGGYIEGPGTGRSDSIPAKIYQDGMPVQEARLSDGEFVMTERAVRGAGDGDRAKGAAKMYRLMQQFERGGRV